VRARRTPILTLLLAHLALLALLSNHRHRLSPFVVTKGAPLVRKPLPRGARDRTHVVELGEERRVARLRQAQPGGGQCLQHPSDGTLEVELRGALLPHPLHEQGQLLGTRATSWHRSRSGAQLGQHLVRRVKQRPAVHRLGASKHCGRAVRQPIVRDEGLLAKARGQATVPGGGDQLREYLGHLSRRQAGRQAARLVVRAHVWVWDLEGGQRADAIVEDAKRT
jgi:hypothetical protein